MVKEGCDDEPWGEDKDGDEVVADQLVHGVHLKQKIPNCSKKRVNLQDNIDTRASGMV